MTSKKPAKKTTAKKPAAKKAAPKKAPAKKAAPKADVNENLAKLAEPVVEAPKHGTVIYAADVKSPSLKKKFFAWFKR